MSCRSRFDPPDACDDNPPICDDCEADRDDCGPNCGKVKQWERERDEDIRQAETDHPMHDFIKIREKLMDQHMEREI